MSKKVPVLVSFAYMPQALIATIQKNIDSLDLILDSGAFTAFNTGRTIELRDYMSFLNEIPFPVRFYFTLDSIGDPKRTDSNLVELQRKGFKPVPVFTRGQTRKDFERYAERGLIGIGGIAGTADNAGYLLVLYETGVFANRDVLWLGFWDRDFLLHFKPYSCDTMSWISCARFARSWVYERRQLISFTKETYNRREVIHFCSRYGIDHGLLKQEVNWRGLMNNNIAQLVQTISMIEYQQMIERKNGTKIFLACSTVDELNLILHAHQIISKKKEG